MPGMDGSMMKGPKAEEMQRHLCNFARSLRNAFCVGTFPTQVHNEIPRAYYICFWELENVVSLGLLYVLH